MYVYPSHLQIMNGIASKKFSIRTSPLPELCCTYFGPQQMEIQIKFKKNTAHKGHKYPKLGHVNFGSFRNNCAE